MSPTAQPDVRPSFASALPGETAGPDKNSSSSGTAGISCSKPKSASENREKEQRETIVIISISCFDWLSKQDNKSLRLTSVRHDLNLQLDRHNYLHRGTKTDFLIYTDYKHEYADSAGTRAPVPRREATQMEILDGLAKAVSNGGSVVIYYSGHCCRRGAGKSTLTLNDGYWIYEEDGESRAGPPYLISSDGQRIYGKDVYAALEKGMGIGRNITITLIFDTCHAATFFDKVITFPWVYQAGAIECSTERQRKAQGSPIQIIFLTATKFEEEAHTFKDMADPKRENGAVTKVMTRFYDKARADPKAPRSAEALAEKLYDACHERQTPQIRALFRIRGDFLITH